MAQGDIIRKGSDQEITIALKDTAGDALDLSAYDGVAVYLVQGKNKVVARYCTNTLTDTRFINDKLNILVAASGTLTLILDRAITDKLDEGALYYLAEVQLTDAEYADSRANTETTALAYIAEVVRGGTTKIDIS